MKQLRYIDYDCPTCEAAHTRFVYFDTETEKPDDEPQFCDRPLSEAVRVNEAEPYWTVCDEMLVPREMSGVGWVKTIVKGNSDFNERERARLEKRQGDHWKRRGLDEAVDRDRAFSKKHGVAPGFK